MSDDATQIDVDGVRANIKKVSDEYHDFATELDKLKTNLGSHYGAWRNDKPGQTFASNYLPAEKKVMGELSDVQSSFEQILDIMTKAPDTLRIQDSDNGGSVSS